MARASLWGTPAGSAETTTARLSFCRQIFRRTCAIRRGSAISARRGRCSWTRCRFLDRRSPIAAILTEPFRFWSARKPSRKRTPSTSASSVIITLAPTCSAATQLRRRRYCGQPSSTQLELDSSFRCPGIRPCWGTLMRSTGNSTTAVALLEAALERSQEIHMPIPDVVRRARCSARRSRPGNRGELSTSPRPRLALRGRADIARSKRSCFESKRPRCSASTPTRPRPRRTKAMSLREELGLGPEQGHGLRTLGDIMAAKGDTTKAEELHDLARAKFRSLGMKRWAEGPWR